MTDEEHNADAARVLRELYSLGEHPRGKFYAAPKAWSIERIEGLIAWLRRDQDKRLELMGKELIGSEPVIGGTR